MGKRGRRKRVHLDVAFRAPLRAARTVAYHPQRAGRRLSRIALGAGRLPKVKGRLTNTRFGMLRAG